jgi:hypothetical protein
VILGFLHARAITKMSRKREISVIKVSVNPLAK